MDQLLTIGEAPIRQAVKEMALRAKVCAEPSACVGIAAALDGQIDTSREKAVLCDFRRQSGRGAPVADPDGITVCPGRKGGERNGKGKFNYGADPDAAAQ